MLVIDGMFPTEYEKAIYALKRLAMFFLNMQKHEKAI